MRVILITLLIVFSTTASLAGITVDSIIHMKTSCSTDTIGTTTGAIYISHTVSAPANKTWTGPNGFSASTEDITGLTDPGQYTLVIKRFGAEQFRKVISLGYSTDYGFFAGTQEIINGTSVDIKNIFTSNWCRGAGSKNILADSTDGWIEYKATSTNIDRLMGLSGYHKTSSCNGELDYGIYLKNNGNLHKQVSGTDSVLGSYSTGDLIRIARTSDTIRFYLNGIEYSSNYISGVTQGKMHADVSIYTASGEIENLACSFKPPFEVDIDITNISCGDTTGGSISLNPCGGEIYSYSWSPSGDTTSSITNLGVGTHTVTITDTADWIVIKKISIGYDVFWNDQNNTTYTYFGEELEKTSGSGTTWDAGGNTFTVLPASTDGWVEYEVVETDKERVFGFSKSPSTDHGLDSLNYGFILQSGEYLKRNILGAIAGGWGTLKQGDILKLERIGSTLYFYSNDYPQGTYAVTATDSLYVESSFYTSNGKFEKMRSSFNCPEFIVNPKGKLVEKVEAASSLQLLGTLLQFDYYEKYHVDVDRKLTYNIYDEQRTLIAGIDENGSDLITNSPTQSISYGFNSCELDLSNLTLSSGEYILEVITPKNDKTYLRFKL